MEHGGCGSALGKLWRLGEGLLPSRHFSFLASHTEEVYFWITAGYTVMVEKLENSEKYVTDILDISINGK